MREQNSEENIRKEFIFRKSKSGINYNDSNYSGITFSKSIYRKSIKRSNFSGVEFYNAEFIRSAFSGSTFDNVTFLGVRMRGNALVSCVFSNCSFINKEDFKKISSNFSNSSFYNCTFKNITFVSCSFIKSQFVDCTFINCVLASSTFEDAEFIRCEFNCTDAGRTNIEFCQFTNCRFFNNCILPLYQIFYIIGGVEHACNIENSIDLKSHLGLYSARQLINYQTQKILDYYYSTRQYFALVNVYLMCCDIGNAKKTLFEGIEYYLLNKNFRLIKHMCRLGKINGILDVHQGKEILHLVDTFLTDKSRTSNSELSSFLMHSAELRSLIYYYCGNDSVMTFEIQTNIPAECRMKANAIIDEIEEIFIPFDNLSHSIQFRHDSPFLIFCTVIGGIAALYELSKALYGLGKFIYKKAKGKTSGETEDTVSKPQSSNNVTVIINGNNNEFFGDFIGCKDEITMNENIDIIVNKIISDKTATVVRFERNNKNEK